MSTAAGPEPIDPILTIDEAAAYLAIPKGTLYTWRARRAGFGPRAVKMGGVLRYRRSDLDAWVRAHLEDEPDQATSSDSQRGKASHHGAGASLVRRSSPRR